MRQIIGITLLLLGVGSLFCQGRAVEISGRSAPAQWVRTVDGWERPDAWSVRPVTRPTLNPLVVAAGQVLLSAFALAICKREPTADDRNS